MTKSETSAKKVTKEQLKDIVKQRPKQTEKEIFTDTDAQGFNRNPSEQANYPGVQKHKQNSKRDKRG